MTFVGVVQRGTAPGVERALQVLLNPLHDPDEKIKPNEQVAFHQAVLGAARKNHIY